MTDELEVDYIIAMVKLSNGQDIASVYAEIDKDHIMLFSPLEIYFEDFIYNTKNYQLVDWLPASKDKTIYIESNKVFSMLELREDIFSDYVDFLGKEFSDFEIEDTRKEKETNTPTTNSKVINMFTKD